MDLPDAEAADAWELRHDDATGHGYYYNHVTGDMVWEDGQTTSAWTEAYDDSGAVYYVNVETSETSWEPPPGFIASSLHGGVSTSGTITEPAAAVDAPPKTRRPSTAEQMKRLNALLSGEDDDNEGEGNDGDGNDAPVDFSQASASPPVESHESSSPSTTMTATTSWMMVINESDGVPYYYNYVTGECVWEPPAEYVAHLEQEQVVEAAHEDAPVLEPDGAVDLAEHVTPDIEDKVRRAIESVSKTPVGSSRLLLVRTPTLRGSRPSSSSASTARRPASASQTSQTVEPTTVEVMTIETRQQSLDEKEQNEDDELRRHEAMMEELQIEESALVLQCLVRCFVARRRVQRRREQRSLQLESAQEREQERESQSDEAASIEVAETPERDENAVEKSDPVTDEGMEVNEKSHREDKDKEETEKVSAHQDDELFVVSERDLDDVKTDNQLSGASVSDTLMASEADLEDVKKEDYQVSASPREVTSESPVEDECAALVVGECVELEQPVAASEREQPDEREERASEALGEIVPPHVETEVNPLPETNLPAVPETPSVEIATTTEPTSSAQPNQSNPEPPLASSPSASMSSPSGTHASQETARSRPPSMQRSSRSRSERRPISPNRVMMRNVSTPIDSSRALRVLEIASYFPARRQPGNRPAPARPSAVCSTGIPRKPLPIKPLTPIQTATEREQRKSTQEMARSATRAMKVQEQQRENTRYQEVFASAAQAAREEHDRLVRLREAQRANALEAQQALDTCAAQKTQQAATSAVHVSSILAPLESVDRLSPLTVERLLTELQEVATGDVNARVCLLERERRHRMQQTLSTLRSEEKRVQSHIDAIELSLVSEDDSKVEGQRRRFQAQYLSKLRVRRNELLALIAWWERRVASSLSSDADDELELHATHRLHAIASDLSATTHQLLHSAGDTLLHAAAWKGCASVVQLLVDELHVPVNIVDSTITRSTPLHEAARAGHEHVVQFLLSRGGALDAQDTAGDTPLHVACRLNQVHVVQALVASGEALESEPAGPCLTQTRSWLECFNLCNAKRRRAMDLVTLPSLKESLRNYSHDLDERATIQEPASRPPTATLESPAAIKKKITKKKVKAKLPMRSDSLAQAASLVLHA